MIRNPRWMTAALLVYLACSWACAARRTPEAPQPPAPSRLVTILHGK
jgi:hypothetical protein